MHSQEHPEVVTSNTNLIIFFPGLNQAPESFVFKNKELIKVTLSFNSTRELDLASDILKITKILKTNPSAKIIAHSLSALLIEWIIQNGRPEFAQLDITYVAPAFYPTSLLSNLFVTISKYISLPIPSLARRSTRINWYVDLKVYASILDYNKQIDISLCQHSVIVDEDDEVLKIDYLKMLRSLKVVRENKFPHHRCYETFIRLIDWS